MRHVMLRALLAALLVLPLAAADAVAQQGPPGARRAQLEARLITEFLDRSQEQVRFSNDQRVRIEAIMRASVERHREHTQRSMQLRRELGAAVAQEATSDAQYMRLLERMQQLRAEEQEAWRADQRAIGTVLSPRQHAIFAFRWLELQERARVMIGQRRGAGPPRR